MRNRLFLWPLILLLGFGASACQTFSSLDSPPRFSEESCGHCPTLSEWKALLNAGNFGIISAGRNPADQGDRALDDKAIADRHRALGKELKELGLSYYEGRGYFEGRWEISYLLRLPPGFDPNILRDLARRYHQQSVIIARQGEQALVYTSGPDVGRAYVGRGWKELPSAKGDFTEVRGPDGQFLRFQLNFDFSKAVLYE